MDKMDLTELEKKYALLEEKYMRHEGILIQAYKTLKKREFQLKQLNDELSASEEEIKANNEDLKDANEKISSIIEELYGKNAIIEKQNAELTETLKNLEKAQTELLQSEKMASLGILTAGIAHEINNPLNYIMGSYNVLDRFYNEGSLDQTNKDIGEVINALRIGVERASAIVQGLKQFSRVSESYDEKCNLKEIIENSLMILNNKLKNCIKITKTYPAEDAIILGNIGRLHQVFLNIIANAADAIVNEGEIYISVAHNLHEVYIELRDTGIGIPKEDIKKITDPFFTNKEPGKGTGLGLYITYNIIEEHKGKIAFESASDQGTIVKLTLPKNTN